MENTVNINAVDGKVEVTSLVGRDFRILEDHTAETFATDSLADYVKYCEPYEVGKHDIFYNMCNVYMYDSSEDSRYAKPVAHCLIGVSDPVKLIRGLLNMPMNVADFETFLFRVRPFMADAVKTLYAYVRNFKVTKLTSITRTVDTRGNYEYSVKREKGGQDDVEIPDTITLRLPPIEGVAEEDWQEFTLDLSFDWEDTNDGVKLSFKLSAPQWNVMETEAVKSTIKKYLDTLPHTAFWGEIGVTKQDDSWKYLFNAEPAPTINASVAGYQHRV